MDLTQIFPNPNPIIGVVHLLPLPSSARWGGNLQAVIDRAEQEATALAAGGIDGLIVENFFDAPFPKEEVDPAVVSAMTLIVQRLMNLVVMPVGVNVLRNDAKSAIAIATACGCPFIRVNVLTGVMATDQGTIEGKAHQLLRYRREMGSNAAIIADVLVKHAQPLSTSDLAYAARETIERGLADAIAISGWGTGSPPRLQDLEIASRVAGEAPVFIGSGATEENIGMLLGAANGAIVASSLKRNGNIKEPIDPIRVQAFVEAARQPEKPQPLLSDKAPLKVPVR
ncbi:photosystem I biogenesis protein BtpA [Oscillatoria sp. FACHB-1406]|uniref:photosystem I biogenesis protein BtpA n=1 Tax=Oscillatoria sp. FACHB-1406 TaxID=2692846 RepID=UPI0016826993|nr:BtpA/SgcQ family protein [Oscillatoria sp. FACHB-1406]